MKKPNFILLVLFFVCLNLKSQLSGNAYLSGQTNHSGIKIKFIASSGTAATDSVYTSASGAYTANISNGVYSLVFSKTGYLTQSYNNGATLLLTNTVVLNNATLLPGNEVFVSGNVSGNWINTNVYIVNGDITVPSGSQLTIQAGTTVRFNGNYSLISNGTLSAVGTASNKILFTSNLNPQIQGDWHHIEPNNSACIIDYCIMEYGRNGIYFSASSPTISNSIIRNMLNVGIYCNTCQPKILNNKVHDTGGEGITVEVNSCCGTIECNEIYNCSDTYYSFGIISGANIVRNNSIHDITTLAYNSSVGLQVRGNSKIENNYIFNCAKGIDTDNSFGAATPTISNNTVRSTTTGIIINMPMVIINNIITDNTYGIRSFTSSTANISHNLVWNNSTANLLNVPVAGIGQIVSTNAQGNAVDSYFNMSQDPLFMSGNVPSLSVNSPCLNAGDPAFSTNIGFNTTNACSAATLTGLNSEEKKSTSLNVYPNPTNGFFHIHTNSGDIKQARLINISGQEVNLEKISETDFNASALDSGIYFLLLETQSGFSSTKLLIAH